MRLLDSANLTHDKQDSLSWIYDPTRGFSIKSFSLQVQKPLSNSYRNILNAAAVWKGMAPPRAELIAWSVHLQSLNTR